MKTKSNKISYFILTFIFLIIIASFLFSGFDNFSAGLNSNVASVDGTPITIREYQTALNRQIEFFSQMMGRGVSQKQLENMGLKQSVLNSLVQQKLILNFATSMGVVISEEEIKQDIKSMSYFQTDNKFNVNLYRNMLQNNSFSPSQFEKLVANDSKQKKINKLMESLVVSQSFVKDIVEFKDKVVMVQGAKISRQSLTPLISVSDKEISDFITKPENKSILESLYKENFAKYNKPEQIKARHILVSGSDKEGLEKIKKIQNEVTPKNFAKVAKKETQDPSGKASGGDLGWFSRGKMTPDFEKVAFSLKVGEISQPVKTEFGYHLILVENKKKSQTKTLDTVQNELARMALQKQKSQDLDLLLKSTQERISSYLEKNQYSKLESLTKEVNGEFFANIKINHFDQKLAQTSLTTSEAEKLFSGNEGDIISLGNPGVIFLLKILNKTGATQISSDKMSEELTTQKQLLSKRVRDELDKNLMNKSKIVTNQNLL